MQGSRKSEFAPLSAALTLVGAAATAGELGEAIEEITTAHSAAAKVVVETTMR
jgi:hypothetical protein